MTEEVAEMQCTSRHRRRSRRSKRTLFLEYHVLVHVNGVSEAGWIVDDIPANLERVNL